MKSNSLPKWQGFVCAMAIVFSAPAVAFEQGDWLVRFGASTVNPKSDNHPVVSAGDGTSMTFNFSYMMTRNWAVELLAAYPFKHDVDLVGGPKVADIKHLPPTLNLQYHFAPDSKFQPYIGAGLNYTTFFSESTEGALAGTKLSLDDSFGLGYQIGADIIINEKWFFNIDARYLDIDSDATLDGADLGTVEIDPYVYGIHLGFRF